MSSEAPIFVNALSGDEAAQPVRAEYPLINLLRFVAAAWVLVFHAQFHFGELTALAILSPVIQQGVLAMSLFFILSGFILSFRYSSFPDRESLKKFYIARISRLYPVYLITGALTIWTLFGQMGDYPLAMRGTAGATLWVLIVIVLFVTATQAWFPSLFPVWNFGGSWSLSVEAFFYALFPHLRTRLGTMSDRALLLIALGIPVLALVIAAGLQANLTKDSATSIVFYSVPIYRLPEFILGIAGFILFVQRDKYRTVFLRASVALSVIGVIAIYTVGNLPGNIEYGGLFMGIFLCSFILSAQHLNLSAGVSRVFNWLGHISYCLYLVQFGTVPAFKQFFGHLAVESQWLIFISANFVFAVILFYGCEKPLHKPIGKFLARRLIGRTNTQASAR